MMMHKFTYLTLLILSFCLFTSYFTNAQKLPEFAWAKKLGAGNNDGGRAIAVDKNGNVYTAGWFQDTVDIDFGNGVQNLISKGQYDVFITKQDSLGNLLWARSFGGSSNDIASALVVDDTGNVYVTGYFTGKVDFDPGPGTTIYTSKIDLIRGAYTHDIYLTKFDTAGNLLWARAIGGTGGDNGNAINIDRASGDILVTGAFRDAVDFGLGGPPVYLSAQTNSVFVIKVKNTGDLVWAKGFGGTASVICWGIAPGPSGTVYLTGSFLGTADFDPDTANSVSITSVGNTDVFVSKFDSSGSLIWAKSMGGPDADAGKDIIVDDSGYAYLTGSFQNTANFDPNGVSNLNSIGAADIFITKLDTDGNLVWAKNVGSRVDDFGEAIALDAFGNVYTTGAFQASTTDFNPGLRPEDTFNLASYGGFDIFILKLNNSGDFEWAINAGAKGAPDWGYDIAVKKGYIYTTGNFYKTADFDPLGPGLNQLNAYDQLNNDVFILKLRDCISVFNPALAIEGPDSICNGMSYIYALPDIPGAISYSWTLPSGWTGTSTTDSITVMAEYSGTINVVIRGACDTLSLSLDITSAMPDVEITVDEFVLSTTNPGSYTNWQWYLEGQEITGATDSTYTVNKNGIYSVVVTGEFGCRDTAFYKVTNVTAVKALKGMPEITIYPNPVMDVVHVRAAFPLQIEITTVDGRKILSEHLDKDIKKIKTDDLIPGIYLLHLKDEQGYLLKVEKLIKVSE